MQVFFYPVFTIYYPSFGDEGGVVKRVTEITWLRRQMNEYGTFVE